MGRLILVAASPTAQRPRDLVVRPGDRIIAVDGGWWHAQKWGWPVDLLVGDLDSLAEPGGVRPVLPVSLPIQRAPVAKDETDLELALAAGLRAGPVDEVLICGALGGRLDHELANVMLLLAPELRSQSACLLDGPVTLHALRGPGVLAIDGAPGDTVSLIPFITDATGVRTEGLAYPLHSEVLYLGRARGVSNVMSQPHAQVSVTDGTLLVLLARKE
jgi:thiamine pyrophosphokinase